MKILGIIILLIILISCNTNNTNKLPATSEDTSSLMNTGDSTYTESTRDSSSVKLCGDLVKEILRSSPRYKKLTNGLLEAVKKNGGKSVDISLDKSPDPGTDNAMVSSPNYEMQVSENYTNRQVNVAHFVFDPQKQQLYEYDVVKDQLVIVEFNRDLLMDSKDFCK